MQCLCPDSSGKLCVKEMTKEEEEQDGMCDVCACHVWEEIRHDRLSLRTPNNDTEYIWYHKE